MLTPHFSTTPPPPPWWRVVEDFSFVAAGFGCQHNLITHSAQRGAKPLFGVAVVSGCVDQVDPQINNFSQKPCWLVNRPAEITPERRGAEADGSDQEVGVTELSALHWGCQIYRCQDVTLGIGPGVKKTSERFTLHRRRSRRSSPGVPPERSATPRRRRAAPPARRGSRARPVCPSRSRLRIRGP
jgi:hypothetical protein